MEGIVWIIALIGGVYVFGMSTSPSGEIEKISDEKKEQIITKGIEIQSTFVVNTDDFNIEIPTIVVAKISKQVSIHLKTAILK